MNDTPETPQATTPPTTPQSEAKKKITRSIINQKHVKTLDKTNLVLTAAQKPGYAALLAGSEIDGPFVDQLTTDTAACSTRARRPTTSSTPAPATTPGTSPIGTTVSSTGSPPSAV